jgi:hypothetical protein
LPLPRTKARQDWGRRDHDGDVLIEALLTAILGRHRGPRGILFDLPQVVRDAPALIEARGCSH